MEIYVCDVKYNAEIPHFLLCDENAPLQLYRVSHLVSNTLLTARIPSLRPEFPPYGQNSLLTAVIPSLRPQFPPYGRNSLSAATCGNGRN